MFYSEDGHGRAADLRRLGAQDVRGRAVPARRSARATACPTRSCSTARKASMPPQMPRSVSAAVQRAGQGDSPAQRRQRLGLSRTARRARVTLIVRLHYADGTDRGPRAQERRALRRLHPPRRCARLAIRLRPPRPAAPLPRRHAAAARADRADRAGQRPRRHRARRDGGDGGDAAAIVVFWKGQSEHVRTFSQDLVDPFRWHDASRRLTIEPDGEWSPGQPILAFTVQATTALPRPQRSSSAASRFSVSL